MTFGPPFFTTYLGTVKLIDAPSLVSSTQMRPPCISTSALATARPSALPLDGCSVSTAADGPNTS